MTTRAELRASVRQRLEDAGATPLWEDAALNDALAGAVRAYGARFPAEETTAVEVVAGATRVPVAGIEAGRVVRVLDPAGGFVPRQADAAGDGAGALPVAQAWRWWDGELVLDRPAAAGSWRIEHLKARTPPGDDVAAVDVGAGDEEIVVALAAATALRRRAAEDAKRGMHSGGIAALAEALRAEAGRLLAARRRRARGSWLG
jgi:hypothetical protein